MHSDHLISCHVVVTAVLALAGLPAHAAGKGKIRRSHKAHEHGAAKLDVAIDGKTVTLQLEIPGNDAFGFEHAPATEVETKTVSDTMARLREKADELFSFGQGPGCTPLKSAVSSSPASSVQTTATSQGGKVQKTAAKEDHADVVAEYTFTCQKSPVGAQLKLPLFTVFPHLKTVRVQVLGGTTQSGATVRGASDVIPL
jgi:hypothetical protein